MALKAIDLSLHQWLVPQLRNPDLPTDWPIEGDSSLSPPLDPSAFAVADPRNSEDKGIQVWSDVAVSKPWPMVRCEVVEFEGEQAICRVQLDGFEVSRVGFPAVALRHHKLEVGNPFIWVMRDARHITSDDIDPDTAPAPTGQLTAEESAEFDDLYQRAMERIERGEVWEEYLGPGE